MRLFAKAVILIFVAPCAFAQRPGTPAVLNQPFVATGTETVQVAGANGALIEHVTTIRAARDSAGRTWMKKRMVDPLHPQSAKDLFQVSMYDPQVRTLSVWCTCDGVVRVTHLGRPLGSPATRKGEQAAVPAPVAAAMGPMNSVDGLTYRYEALPDQTLLGLRTQGLKSEASAGEGTGVGAKVVTTSSWYAADLGLSLLTIEQSAGDGTHRSEFKELKREEPADELFYSPCEYVASS